MHAKHIPLLTASSNPGKLKEYQTLAASYASGAGVELALLPNFAALPQFDESAPTFAENAAGKALHYSRFADQMVIADDSGLAVVALGGAPGPQSARYAGPGAGDSDRVKKLLGELREKNVTNRRARFVCVLAAAQQRRMLAVLSECVDGVLLELPRGQGGFGYDPIFLFEPLGKTFAELSREEKNQYSHRGKAFRKLLEFLKT